MNSLSSLPASTGTDPLQPRGEFRTLTSLRGIAAATILAFHALHGFRGYLAVDLFFLLSGFVLTHAYGDLQMDRASIGRFLRARLARIYPVHLVVLLALSPLMGPSPFAPAEFVASLALLQGPWFGRCWNFAAWSIGAEWHAYLLFPVLVAVLRALPARAVGILLVGCSLTLAILEARAGTLSIVSGVPLLLRALPEFVAGMALYRLKERAPTGDVAGWTCLAAPPLFVAVGAPDVVVVISLGVLLVVSAVNRGRVARFLGARPFAYLGRISYSLYMVQAIPQVALAQAYPDASRELHALMLVGATVPLGIGLSYAVEQPARRWLRAYGRAGIGIDGEAARWKYEGVIKP